MTPLSVRENSQLCRRRPVAAGETMNRERESVKLRKWEFWGKNLGVVGRRAMPALLVPASSRRLGDDTGTPTDRPPGTTLGSGERGVGLPGQVPINHPPLHISAPTFTTLLFCPPSSSLAQYV